MATNIKTPYILFTDIDGRPLEDGNIYIGAAGLDPIANQITVYSDASLSTTISQPIKTRSGLPYVSGSPVRLYVSATDFSLLVNNTNGATVAQDLNAGANQLNLGAIVQDANGKVGIGTSSPQEKLHIEFDDNSQEGVEIKNPSTGTGAAATLKLSNSANSAFIDFFSTLHGSFANDMRIRNLNGDIILDTGNVGIGTSSPDELLDIEKTGSNPSIRLNRNDSSIAGSVRLTCGDNENGLISAGPKDLTLQTNNTERMRIDSAGNLLVGKTSANTTAEGLELRGPDGLAVFTRDGDRPLILNRKTNDGIIIDIQQDNTAEGSVSVSGTTVSYNGAHLSRWSQLTTERQPILRGTVMSNLDEMCEWAYPEQPEVLWEAGDGLPEGVSVGDVKVAAQPAELDEEGNVVTEAVDEVLWGPADGFPEGVVLGDVRIPYKAAGVEDNEQLNKMKVSDVEGDRNVAGVFQAWDDDDDTYENDFYCAMTGDFVIRIAAGTTVQRGDLLMSAGDGTAKPQADDLVRSCTIAKVTSTNVSCTHEDGSYCVPCVLMAC